ncbi:MAG: peptidylprolyl isomerase [Bacteroidia bacterium]|nr:peptidylprolyl isomerase [Bacteroidia bacterium]
MKQVKLLLIALSITFVFAACKDDTPEENASTQTFIELNTSFGSMYLHLYDSTPLHKANFEKLLMEGFYDSTEFHRIVTDFVIQGGDPNSKDDDRTNDGSGGPGYTIEAEIDSSRFKHIYGAIGAARTTNPARRSSGSQFYIVTSQNGSHFLDGEYTVFGELIGGKDIAKTIEGQPKNSKDLPNDRIPMTVKYVNLTNQQIGDYGITNPIQ